MGRAKQKKLRRAAKATEQPVRKKRAAGEAACCALCKRLVSLANEHHMIPKSRGGTQTETLCLDCHAMIHTLFSNKELEAEFSSVDSLLHEPRMAKYVNWVAKRPGTARYKPKSKRNVSR